MPGQKHEKLINFVVDDKISVLKFLGFDLPDGTEVTAMRGSDMTEATPKQLLADGYIAIGEPPFLGLVIEVQTSMDSDAWVAKQLAWPHYALGLRSQLKCVTETLVITTSSRIEKLARQPIQIGQNLWWTAMVLGPSTLPKECSTEFAQQNPTIALLALMAHGRKYRTPELPAKLLKGLWESKLFQALENSQQRIYYDRAMRALPLWIALALKEDAMTQEYFSPIVLDFIAQGREQGIQQGREQGIEQGREQGREQGIEAGLRQSILLLLDTRGYTPTPSDLQRIESQHEKSVLEDWVKAAANQTVGQPFFKDH